MLITHINKGLSYLRYTTSAKGLHGIHSPFVYEFASAVLFDKAEHEAYKQICKSRQRTFNNRNLIETVDFGATAGKRDFETYRIRVNALSKKRSLPTRYLKLLYRISRHFKPQHILEFGTSTGLSTIALALGSADSHVTTMEGCASVASVAQSNFDHLNLQNIHIAIGNFNQILMPTLESMQGLDMVFFDGNHRKKPTIDYFTQCLARTNEKSIFVFDDIHWSEEMEEAWEIIKDHPKVSISIDLFQLGIVFFKTGIEKQHFILRNN